MTHASLRIGLLLNPLAGIGGAVGLKGSDGIELQALAKQRSGTPQAATRTQVFFTAIEHFAGLSDRTDSMVYLGRGNGCICARAGGS